MNGNSLLCEQVLISLRRINRALDQQYRRLMNAYGLTGPQLLVLRQIHQHQEISIGELAREINLSNATITDIVDRLERRGLVVRMRGASDKRRVLLTATDSGLELMKKPPSLLHGDFVEAFAKLQEWEQMLILSSLERVASMICVEDNDTESVLAVTSLARSKRRKKVLRDGDETISEAKQP
jgi:DNA-binding MarR family transcriptional regulator